MSTVSLFAVSMTIGTPDSAADRPADVDAVHAGEHEVEQDDVRPQVPDGRQRARAVADDGGVESLTPQHDGQHLGQRRVVVDHQYARLHAASISHLTPTVPCAARRTRRTAPILHARLAYAACVPKNVQIRNLDDATYEELRRPRGRCRTSPSPSTCAVSSTGWPTTPTMADILARADARRARGSGGDPRRRSWPRWRRIGPNVGDRLRARRLCVAGAGDGRRTGSRPASHVA